MKEIIAIIRPNKVEETKETLEKLGFPSITAHRVQGRGRQRGIAGEVQFNISPELLAKGKSAGMKYVPKRLLHIIIPNDAVDPVVKAIIKVNQTAQIGDGKIFVCPVDTAVRIRTDEVGESAIK
jgi:nitrogen regulatory protein PII 2